MTEAEAEAEAEAAGDATDAGEPAVAGIAGAETDG
jgi:hypothetical protein